MHGSREAKPPVRHMLIGAAKPGAGPPPIPVRFRIGVGLGTGKKKTLFKLSLYSTAQAWQCAHPYDKDNIRNGKSRHGAVCIGFTIDFCTFFGHDALQSHSSQHPRECDRSHARFV